MRVMPFLSLNLKERQAKRFEQCARAVFLPGSGL